MMIPAVVLSITHDTVADIIIKGSCAPIKILAKSRLCDILISHDMVHYMQQKSDSENALGFPMDTKWYHKEMLEAFHIAQCQYGKK